MSYFKAKMHQIRFRRGCSQRSLRHPSWIQGVLLLREGEGREEWRGGKGKGREGEGEGCVMAVGEIVAPVLTAASVEQELNSIISIKYDMLEEFTVD